MPRVLGNQAFFLEYGERFLALCRAHDLRLEPLTLPQDPNQRLEAATLADIEVAVFTGTFEADAVFTRRYLGSALHAPNLKWMHLPNAGIDHPVFGQLLAHGVRLTTSSGATAGPIAQSAIGGLLALARGFPAWYAAQLQHAWQPHRRTRRDLHSQTMVVVGLGAIGNEIARLARALGLRVSGIRRSPRRAADHVDELYPPPMLLDVLPRADWLVLSCPLTEQTHHLIDAAALRRLPATAHIINVARGEVVEEAALIAALQQGRLAGAYLDVFAEEPLPPSSPLWNLPNVIISPHDSAGSSGNAARVSEIFLRNLEHWGRGDALENEVFADR